MPAAIKVLGGLLKDRVLVLPTDRPFILGRSLEANLTLYGHDVEDRHAVIVAEGNDHRLVPVARELPTLLGKRRLTEARLLQDGDHIQIGKHAFLYASSSSRAEIGPGAEAAPDRHCATCGEPLGPEYLSPQGAFSLQALRLGKELVCPRCVDMRLNVDSDLEDYRVLRKIGANDDEITYLAVDRRKNERVALRILKADRQANPFILRRFLARAMAGLVIEHANFLESLAFRSSHGITFVVLEHLDSSWKFESFVREQAPLPARSAVGIANQLAEILRYGRAHGLLVAKRKKSGVLVGKRQLWLKVQSFDITRELERSVSQTRAFRELVERAGLDPDKLLAAGFPEPKDPEEARLSRLANEFAEVFSVGRVLYQLLVGKSFRPNSIAMVRSCLVARKGNLPNPESSLERVPTVVLQLLDRVLSPSGPARIRELIDFSRASKATFQALQAQDEQTSPSPP